MSEIQEKIIRYFADKKEVVAVYLFGSFASGKERPRSDIDLAILFDEMDRDLMLQKRIDYLVGLGRVLRKDIHPVILNTAGEVLLEQVFTKGSCVFVNDPKKLARHKMVMFAKIAEFAYYKKQMQSGLIKEVLKRNILNG